MDIYNKEMLNEFIAENPLRFSEKRLALVRRDFYNHKRGTVSDEFVDYVLWLRNHLQDMNISVLSCCRSLGITVGMRFSKSVAERPCCCPNICIRSLETVSK